MVTLQNSRSAFRELRRKSGYRTQRELATRLRASTRSCIATLRSNVRWWDHGGRPTWRRIPLLARAFGIEEGELIKKLWKETLGSLCDCGCGGVKVPPTQPNAKRLYIKSSCKRCGDERTDGTGHYHRKLSLCKRCLDITRTVERIKLTCVGYRFHEAQNYSKRCSRVNLFLPGDLARFFRHKRDDESKQHIFADLKRREYRCRWCAGAFRMLSWSEINGKQLFEQNRPRENVPRIRTREDLRELRRRVFPAEFKNTRAVGAKPGYRVPLHRALARWWRQKDPEKFPGVVQGLCGICGGLLLNYNRISHGSKLPLRFHSKCFLNYQKQHNGKMPPEPPSKPGHQRDIESLRRKFAWTIRHEILKDSLGEIAHDFNVRSKNSVVEGIADIKSLLPKPELVPQRFTPIVLLLRF